MTPQKENDDTSWLVYADWLEENDQKMRADELRREIYSPILPKWNYEYWRGAGVVGAGAGVGAGVGGY